LDVRKELEELMVQSPDNPLLASLNLSINRLDPEAKEWIKRLGVFQSGAMEPYLIAVTEIDETRWYKLKEQLEATGLIQVESLTNSGVLDNFIKFHPTLAPIMWSRATSSEKKQILNFYCQYYFQLARYLYIKDTDNSFLARVIAKRELPNLLFAVGSVIESGGEFACQFVESVNNFLRNFGLNKDRRELAKRLQQIKFEVGSDSWYLAKSILGEQSWSEKYYSQAWEIFQEILAGLSEVPSYQRCITLGRLGRCYLSMEQPQEALKQYQLSLDVASNLDQDQEVKRQIGILRLNIGDVLADIGEYHSARNSYEEALIISQDLRDCRGEAAVQAQIGSLELRQNKFTEAIKLHKAAFKTFQKLNEPDMVAVSSHQLGIAFQALCLWEEAEKSFRIAAQINEQYGDVAGAVESWNQLGLICKNLGKLPEAEEWYRKVLEVDRRFDSKINIAKDLSNIANLLQQCPQRVNEAQLLAEESLEIMQTLDPAVADIWKIYDILSQISDKQGDLSKVQKYRRLSRHSRANFAGTHYALRQYAQLMSLTIKAVNDVEVRQQLEPFWDQGIQLGKQNLVAAIRQILNGQRDEDILCERLDIEEAQVVLAILGQVEEKK
jgi:tetratricopeptide (TPR) repeat protein